MLEIEVTQPGAEPSSARLDTGAYLIGSDAACHIRIVSADVSARHMQLILRGGQVRVMDLGSAAGTVVNGETLFAHQTYEIPADATVKIGRAVLRLRPVKDAPVPERTPVPSAAENQTSVAAARKSAPEKSGISVLAVTGVPARLRPVMQEIKKRAHRELLTRLNLKKMALSGVSGEELTRQAAKTIDEIISQLNLALPDDIDVEILRRELFNEAVGLGPLEYLLSRDDITEIMVNGPDEIYVEKSGVIYRTDAAFADANQVLAAIERIVSPLGRRIDESSPMVDARLADGSRVNAVIPPLALNGPTVTIRRFSRIPLTAADLIKFGSASEDIIQFLSVCVAARKNILISGGTGSGKTTLLNILSSFLPNNERIITIEDAAELQLVQEHVVRLEARPPNIEGNGAVTIRDLVRNSLRMRPDRIVVGECRGGETLDMLQAMNTGHDGSLTTIHANSARDALARLETLVLMAGFDLPLRAIREQVASAIQIVVQISRERDGSRKILSVNEITKMEGDVISMQELFRYRQTGWDGANRMTGVFEPTGVLPTFMDDLKRAQLDCRVGMFDPGSRN